MDHWFLQIEDYMAAIAEEGSFSRAAKRLHTSQAFLTRKIAELEKHLGITIFDRTTRRLKLTAAGRSLLPEVQSSLRHAERAWGLAQYHARVKSGPLQIGYSPYSNSELLAVLYRMDLSGMEAARMAPSDSPEPRVILKTGDTPVLIQRVLRGQLHAALGVQPIHDHDLWVEPVYQEAFCICFPRNHPFAHKPFISVRDLHGYIVFWISRATHPAFYDHAIEYIHSTGAQTLFQEVRSDLQAIDLVSRGLGVALLPRTAARLSYSGVLFKP